MAAAPCSVNLTEPATSQGTAGFADNHAAAVKQTVIAIGNATVMMKRFLQLTTAMAAKATANAHAVLRISASAATGRRLNSR